MDTDHGAATALLLDWGGVLTQPFAEGIATWAREEGVDADAFHALLARELGPGSGDGADGPFHRVERGELAAAEFESLLAGMVRRADGSTPSPTGLVERMFRPFVLLPEMARLVRGVRRLGIRVAVLSNSWGHRYDREGWDELFDAVVVSREVGVRKPEPEIFRLTAERLGRELRECVFVDDLGRNVRAARALDMAAVQHHSVAETATSLDRLFGGSGTLIRP